MKKIPLEKIEEAIDKISDAKDLIGDAYTLIEEGMTDGVLYVGEDNTDLANMIGSMQCTCDEVDALLEELKKEMV